MCVRLHVGNMTFPSIFRGLLPPEVFVFFEIAALLTSDPLKCGLLPRHREKGRSLERLESVADGSVSLKGGHRWQVTGEPSPLRHLRWLLLVVCKAMSFGLAAEVWDVGPRRQGSEQTGSVALVRGIPW